ncbi:MAG: cache domain-containing protein [Leptospiraceae bacterium]|nr:cache domain-containing protein [Leptospiraceae bacterium]MDW7976848.1 cache domain-containing protein [Leptospiraceae bacterium]
MFDQIITSLKEKVTLSHQMIERIYQQYEKGEITQSEAKKLAINLISRLESSKNEYFFIFDDEYLMIYHINPKLQGTNVKELTDINGKKLIQEMLKQTQEKNEALVDYYWNKPQSEIIAHKFTYAKRFEPWKWNIATGVYVDDVEERFKEYTNKMYLNLIIIFILSLVAFYIFITFIRKNLKIVEKIQENLEKGIFILPKMKVSNDEIGLLQNSIIKATEHISKLFDRIMPSSIMVENVSYDLKCLSNELKESIQNQHQHFEQISASIEETSVTINEIAKIIQETSRDSSDAMNLVNNTIAMLNETSKTINKIFNLFEDLNHQFDNIQKNSQNVEDILKIIQEIANQTNLIALNASIEAAKSGEKGSRFSVIAEEIRKLSQNSKESSQQIAQTIKDITNSIINFRDQIHNFGNDIIQTKSNFDKFNQILQKLITSFQNINLKISHFASSLEELNVASKDITKNVEINLSESEKILKLSEKSKELNLKLTEALDDFREATKGIKTANYNKYIFDLAKTDHIIFKDKVENFIDGSIQMSEHQLSDYTQCRFGKWYYGDDSTSYRHLKEFSEIEEPHKNFHNLCKEIYHHVKRKEISKARELFNQVESESKKVIEYLDKLKSYNFE